MTLHRRISVRSRITVYATVGSVVLFAAGALLLYHDLTAQLSGAINTELSIRLDALETTLANGGATNAQAVALVQAVEPDGTVVQPVGTRPLLTPSELGRASVRRITIDRDVPGLSGDARLVAKPLFVPGRPELLVGVAAASRRPLIAARTHLALVLSIVGPAISALVALATWVLAGMLLRPVRQMSRAASVISSTHTGQRLADAGGRDEIAELGHTLNAMLGRIELALAHERAFLDDAAHELRTPLAVLRGELELAALDPSDSEGVRISLASALDEADRLARLTTDLLTLARADAGQLLPRLTAIDLDSVVVAAIAHVPVPEEVTVELVGGAVLAEADPDWSVQIVTNLVANAVRYAATTVRVTTADTGTDEPQVVVADDGGGFPEAGEGQLFDRFARGDQARERAGSTSGSGLGLAITATLVSAQGGTIEASNGAPLGGACVSVTFRPAAHPSRGPSVVTGVGRLVPSSPDRRDGSQG